MTYLDFDVTTTMRLIREEKIIFPVVSICNLNPLITKEADHYVREYFQNEYNISVDNYEDLLNELPLDEIGDDFRWLIYQTNDPKFNETRKKSFGFRADQMILDCYFASEKCTLSQFDWYYDYFYGNCFRFNYGNETDQLNSVVTPDTGLELILLSRIPDFDQNFLYSSRQNGLRIIISDQNSTPIYSQGILLRPGVHANIDLAKTKSVSMPEPYSNCQNTRSMTSILAREMRNLGIIYNRKDCLNLCFQKLNIDLFGCYDLQFPRLFDAPPCDNRSIFEKIKECEFNLEECYRLCPFACETSRYELTITYSEFPSKSFYQELIKEKKLDKYLNETRNFTYEMVKQSLISLFIYFDRLDFTEIREHENYKISNLISNIGGTLGLFAGISFLSLIELIDLTINCLIATYKHAQNKVSHGIKFNKENQDVTKF